MSEEYLLYDVSSGYIIAATNIPAVADALIEGFTDVEVIIPHEFNVNNKEFLKKLEESNFSLEPVLEKEFIKLYLQYRRWINTEPLLIDLVDNPPQDVKDIIDLAKIRKEFLTKFYQNLMSIQKRYCLTTDLNFMNSLGHELAQGSKNYLVKEYAKINSIEPEVAYNELKMKHESYMLYSMRLYAAYEHLKQQINRSKNYKECQDAFWKISEHASIQF